MTLTRHDACATQKQLIHFATCAFEPEDIVEIRRLPSGRSTWHCAAELPSLASQLTVENRNGEHIHIGINPRKRRGGTKGEDVRLARCLFADFDGVTIDEARKRWDSKGLPEPTLIVSSGHGEHVYWRLAEPLSDLAVWTRFQRDLAEAVDADTAVTDPPRLARLCEGTIERGTRYHCAGVCVSFVRGVPMSFHGADPTPSLAQPHTSS